MVDAVPPPPIGRQVGTSALWSVANVAVLRVGAFSLALVLAHLVAPHEFGVFTVAITVFNIAMSISELGVASALVREETRSRELAPTVFTISLVNSSVLALLMVVFAPMVSSSLGAPQATSAIRVLSIFVLLSGLSAVPAALMSRDFMQRQRFITDAAFLVASTVVTLVLVLVGQPVLGLAFGQVAGQVVTVILIIAMSPERYWPGFGRPQAKHLLAFGLPLAGSNLLAMVTANVDFIVVGHVLGPTRLGYYNLAFNISGWPVSIFGAVLVSVTLPTLSRVRDKPIELRRHLEAGLSALSAAAFPTYVLMCALAAALIDSVYGSRWHPAWVALVVLSVFGAARVVMMFFSDLVIAIGMTQRLLLIQVVWIVTLVPIMIFGVTRWGIAGAGVAHAVVIVALVVPMYVMTIKRHASVGTGWIRRAMLRPSIAALAAGAAAYAAARPFDNDPLKLLVGVVAGLSVYVIVAGRWLLGLKATLYSMYWREDNQDPDPVVGDDTSSLPHDRTELAQAPFDGTTHRPTDRAAP